VLVRLGAVRGVHRRTGVVATLSSSGCLIQLLRDDDLLSLGIGRVAAEWHRPRLVLSESGSNDDVIPRWNTRLGS
jgi:hypothetical protein